MKFSTVKEYFHLKNLVDQRNFLQTRKCSTKIFVLDRGSVPQTKIFTQSKKFSANKDQKGFLKAKILHPLNTKYHATIFLTL